MKKMTRAALAAVSLAVLAGCHDYRDDYLTEEFVYIQPGDDALRYASAFSAENGIGVIKSGKGLTEADVTVAVSPTALVKYNQAHGTRYVNVPSSFYTLSYEGKMGDRHVLHFGPGESRLMVSVDWRPAAMCDLLQSGTDDYVIPVAIVEAGVSVAEGRNVVLVHPVIPTVSLRTAATRQIVPTADSAGVRTYSEQVLLDHPIPSLDLDVTLSYAPERATEYNAAAVTPPDGVFTLLSSRVTFSAGETTARLLYRIDYDRLLDAGGQPIVSYPSVMVFPVQIDALSEGGVKTGQNVLFIPVTGVQR